MLSGTKLVISKVHRPFLANKEKPGKCVMFEALEGEAGAGLQRDVARQKPVTFSEGFKVVLSGMRLPLPGAA